MPKKHVIISGTGRAGTTFLVQLLTLLKLDTGFSDITSKVSENCNAGMEWDIRDPGAPYIVKSPWLCGDLDQVLNSGSVFVEHAIIPVRSLFEAAESRRDVERRSHTEPGKDTHGGLFYARKPEEQETILTQLLYNLIHTLVKRDIPVTLLHFPDLAMRPGYLFQKLSFLLGSITYPEFESAFKSVSRPSLIHSFEPEHEQSTETDRVSFGDADSSASVA